MPEIVDLETAVGLVRDGDTLTAARRRHAVPRTFWSRSPSAPATATAASPWGVVAIGD
jgi:hypothetical protein